MRADWVKSRTGANVTQMHYARRGQITEEMLHVAGEEGLEPERVRDEVARGRAVIPANLHHASLRPVGVGIALRCKINANIGGSATVADLEAELEKLHVAVHFGADAVMDLSTGGDIDRLRAMHIERSPVPLGTVPLYQALTLVERPEELTAEQMIGMIEHQAEQGVDFMTLHAGIRLEHLPLTRDRLTGIVSRGGSILARWMRHHGLENPLYSHYDRILDICARHDVTLSLGDSLRPGSLADACDRAQFAELDTLGELTSRAWERDVQVMVEGPGHVPFDQIAMNVERQMKVCHGAPFYVLGPLVTDIAPGYDHITSAIGATAAGTAGAAFLCYVTPREHLGLPTIDDVRQGVIAYKIAAHAADIARHRPGARDRDDQLSRARYAFDWERQFELSLDPETARTMHDQTLPEQDHKVAPYCSMCGPGFCAMRTDQESRDADHQPACPGGTLADPAVPGRS